MSHPPSGYGFWFYRDCTPPTISLWLLLCLWVWGIFFGKFQCFPVDDCSAVSCDFDALLGWCCYKTRKRHRPLLAMSLEGVISSLTWFSMWGAASIWGDTLTRDRGIVRGCEPGTRFILANTLSTWTYQSWLLGSLALKQCFTSLAAYTITGRIFKITDTWILPTEILI